jgi:serine/threonine-protein kinase
VQIRRLLRGCLEKDREKRLDSMAAARKAIDEAIAAPLPVRLPSRSLGRVWPITLATVGTALTAFVGWPLIRPAAPTSADHAIVTPAGAPLNVSGGSRDLAVSPDGRHLVYRFGGSITYGSALMLRPIDRLEGQPIADIDYAYAPFFSPDSQWIGVFDGTHLKKIPLDGGPVFTLCEFAGSPLGATWGDDNTIVFASSSPGAGLWRVSADGGPPVALTMPEAARDESPRFPSILPRGAGVLFTIVTAGQSASPQVAVLDPKTGRRKILIRGGSDAHYVDTGHLIFAADGDLRAVRFDPGRLEVLGEPATVRKGVMTKATGAANYAVSNTGTLVYIPGEGAGAMGASGARRTFVWVDRQGNEERINLPARAYGPARLSSDDKRLVVGISERNDTQVWIADLAKQTLRQLTFVAGMNGLPLWTPDDQRVI